MNRHLWLASGLVALTLTGCMVRAQPVVGVSATVTPVEYEPVYPAAAPPPPIAEYRTPPPGYGYIWVDGYWDWTGYDWAWNQGSWAPERVGYVYVQPRYVFDNGRWSYHRSYWNGPEGRRDYEWGRPAGRGAAPVRGNPPAPNYGNQVRGTPPPAVVASPPPRAWGSPPTPATPASPPPRAWGSPPAPAAPASPPPRAWGSAASPPAAHSGWTDPPVTRTPPPTAAPPPRNWNDRSMGAPSPTPGASPSARSVYPQPTEQRPQAFSPQPHQVSPQQAPPSMGTGRGFEPQSHPGPSTSMGAHSGPMRPASSSPSAVVPSGARPAPAPVQGSGVLKRGKPTGH